MNVEKQATQGTQAAQRTLRILSLLSQSHETGLTIAEVVAATGLDRATAYRLLQALAENDYAMRSPNKRYHLGVAAMHIGLAAMSRAPLIGTMRPAMQAIARITNEATYLVIRNGDFAHAIHREFGERTLSLSANDMLGFLLLGLGTAGQALLSTIDSDEIRSLYERHQKAYLAKGFSMQRLIDIASQTRERGYAVTQDSVTVGVTGVGVAFPAVLGMYASLSVAGPSKRIPPSRRPEIAAAIQSQIDSIPKPWLRTLP